MERSRRTDVVGGGRRLVRFRAALAAVVLMAGTAATAAPAAHAGTRVHQLAYVSNLGSNTVSAINTFTDTVVATIPVGTNPNGIAAVPPRAPSR
jgi:YVTN family beta-propeller protein